MVCEWGVTSGKKSFGIFKKRFPFVALTNCFSTRISSFIANHSSCKSIERNLIHCTRCYTGTFCNVFKIHDSALNQMNLNSSTQKYFFPSELKFWAAQTSLQRCQSLHNSSYLSVGTPFPASLSFKIWHQQPYCSISSTCGMNWVKPE